MAKVDGRQFASDLVVSHKSMIAEIARLAACTSANAAASAPTMDHESATLVAEWFERFARMVHHHHTAEDDDVFPLLAQRDTSFVDSRKALEEDHGALTVAMTAVATALAALRDDCAEPERTLRTRTLAARAADLHATLDAHLAREEAAILERMSRDLTTKDIAGFERKNFKRYNRHDIAWSVSWILESSHGADRDAMIKRVPWPLRAMHRLFWQANYRRLTAPLGPYRAAVK